MKKYFIVLLALVSFSYAQAQSKLLQVKDFDSKLNSTPDKVILDVRTAGEYAQGHLNGAVLMDIRQSTFKQQLSKLDRNKPVFVYCLAGSRSEAAAAAMVDMGFKQVYDLDGGIRAWTQAKKPIVK